MPVRPRPHPIRRQAALLMLALLMLLAPSWALVHRVLHGPHAGAHGVWAGHHEHAQHGGHAGEAAQGHDEGHADGHAAVHAHEHSDRPAHGSGLAGLLAVLFDSHEDAADCRLADQAAAADALLVPGAPVATPVAHWRPNPWALAEAVARTAALFDARAPPGAHA